MTQDVENVVSLMNQVIARDGGKLALAKYDQARGLVEVNYSANATPECDTCSFTPEMIQAFLKESLRTHGINAEDVVVNEISAAS